MERDIADYAKDVRLTKPSDRICCEWRKMIDAIKVLGRPLVDEEAERYWVNSGGLAKSTYYHAKVGSFRDSIRVSPVCMKMPLKFGR